MTIEDLNPYPSFRPGQAATIEALLERARSGEKIIELNSPTGTGKSLMLTVFCWAMIAENENWNAIYTTPQKGLVWQLANDEKLDIVSLLGRANYRCSKAKSGLAVDCPVPSKARRKTCPHCEYQVQKDRFLKAELGAATLDKILVDRSIQKPSILIVDESQGLEEKLINQSEIGIPEAVDINDLVESSKQWVRGIEFEVMKAETKLEKVFSGQLLDDEQPKETVQAGLAKAFEAHAKRKIAPFDDEKASKIAKELVRLNRICEKARGVLRMAEEAPDSFIITADRTFRMMSGRQAFQELIMNVKVCVLASGTPNTQLLAPPGYAQVIAPHPIEVERRMVYFMPMGKMNISDRDKTLDKIGPKVAAMHKAHGQNTLCHCHSYKIADTLGSILYDEGCRPMFTEKEDREAGIEAWRKETGRILLSVGMEEGLDLPGPRNCLNIIVKIPFQYLGDEWVVRRSEMDKPLPNVQRFGEIATATAIQQACGRMVRGPNDLGPGGVPKETWILDSSFEFFYKKNWQCFQPWFRESLRRKRDR
ncbi:DEAD/DEAH box helicase family protein [Candidatus Pacearchaeota archaeon]|jgi:Rad3-related DNA helicase|nr:DEAD/DEAH box helicase family protein [Candidatus Pacearchaeota archaeon]